MYTYIFLLSLSISPGNYLQISYIKQHVYSCNFGFLSQPPKNF
ncbi:hypothetical protein BbuMM1_E160 (plasmid) [Borreliella burgdorferi]|nr:hypothetical protein BbuMM1_E160 [Borreliella burgdorferi]